MKRILVPVSCDDPSEKALKLATIISKEMNSKIYVLRVIKTHGGAYFDKDGEIVQDLASDVQKYIDQKNIQTQRLKEWADNINPDAFQIVKYGGVADVILDTMKKYKVGLVVMGNRLEDDNEHGVFGHLTSYLIKKSTIPVFSVKKDLTAEGLSNIVFANEFDHKLSYYDALQDLHIIFKSKVHLLRITGKLNDRAVIEENMDYFARTNMIHDYTKNVYEADNVEAGILKWISEKSFDVLAVKNITKTGGSPLFRKNLSKNFLHNINLSTLIYND